MPDEEWAACINSFFRRTGIFLRVSSASSISGRLEDDKTFIYRREDLLLAIKDPIITSIDSVLLDWAIQPTYRVLVRE